MHSLHQKECICIEIRVRLLWYYKEQGDDRMRFYKNNAYPDVFLHDCQFKMVYKNKNLQLLFDNGFCMKAKDSIKETRGYIQISDISLDEVTIQVYKGKIRLGKYSETVTDISFSDLNRLLQKSSLMIIDEYYCLGQVLYKCCVYPYQVRQAFYRVDITISYENRTLEYYIDENPCDIFPLK